HQPWKSQRRPRGVTCPSAKSPPRCGQCSSVACAAPCASRYNTTRRVPNSIARKRPRGSRRLGAARDHPWRTIPGTANVRVPAATAASALMARSYPLIELDEIAAGIGANGDRGGTRARRLLHERNAMRFQSLVLLVEIVDLERRNRNALVE